MSSPTSPPAHQPDQYLKDAYLGELRGQATFEMLKDHFPDKANELDLLAEIEAATAMFLRPYLSKEVSGAEEAHARAQGQARKAKTDYANWQDFIDQAVPFLERAAQTLQAAERHAPQELRSVYETYTAHERALIDFLLLEREGTNGLPAAQTYLESLAR